MTYTNKQVQDMLQGRRLGKLALVKAGQGLETLVYDENWIVRLEMARQGYGLDILLYDDSDIVRCEVAKQCYRLDILINDSDWRVRYAVAEQGYGLDVLVHDTYWRVRFVVAEQGYRLDILVNDEDAVVKDRAEKLLGSKRHLVETSFGTYNGDLLLYVWEDRYLIVSGCYETDSLTDWGKLCSLQIDNDTAIKYTKVMKSIIEGELK